MTGGISEATFDSATIWTLDARDNVLLPVLADHYHMPQIAIRRSIAGSHKELRDTLSMKGVNYSDLRAALVPSRDRREASFIFDIQRFGRGDYSALGSQQIIPLLRRDSKHSLLSGDLLGKISWVHALVAENVVCPPGRNLDRASQYYAIHINNLTTNGLETIHGSLADRPEYVGFIDCTFSSFVRTYMSTTLSSSYVKNGVTVLSYHEPDVPASEDYNLRAWPWEERNYAVRSVPDYLYDLFLTYKIERNLSDGTNNDTRFSLSAISNQTSDSRTFEVAITPSRVDYLLRDKAGAMDVLELSSGVTPHALSELIQSQLTGSYFYNLRYRSEYSISQFNVIIEVPLADGTKRRALAGLKYTDGDSQLELVTFF